MNANTELYFANEAQAKKYKRIRIIKLVAIYTFLVIGALFTLLPFYWMVATSLKTVEEVIKIPTNFFPESPAETGFLHFFQIGKIRDYIEYAEQANLDTSIPALKEHFNGFGNYVEVLITEAKGTTILGAIKNTLIVGVLTTVGTVTTTVLAAFAFSRLDFKGRDAIFGVLLATMMVPGEMMIITNFETVSNLGWISTYQALIIPFIASVFYTFFLRQNFMQIPNELYYAAKVDGKTDFGYLFKVMIPIARPAIISITILSMIGSWNAYIWPRTVAQEGSMKLVTDGIMSMFSSDTGGETSNIIMAAATLVALPLLIAFICFKKYIMNGVGRAGIKG